MEGLKGKSSITGRFSVAMFDYYRVYKQTYVFFGCVHGVYSESSAWIPHQTYSDLLFEGSLEVKLPTMWTDEKQSRAEAERRERLEERRSEKRKSQKKEDADARKGRKVAKHCVFSMYCGSGGSKSRFAKAAGAETSGEMRNEKLHAVVARSRF